jgi:hypothetical protein
VRAHDAWLGPDVALKISTERFSDRLAREVRAIAAYTLTSGGTPFCDLRLLLLNRFN